MVLVNHLEMPKQIWLICSELLPLTPQILFPLVSITFLLPPIPPNLADSIPLLVSN